MADSTVEQPGSGAPDPVALAAMATLNWGFRVAATLLLIGVAISLARQDALVSELPTLGSMFGEVVDLHGSGFIGLSIFAIVVTPVVTTLSIGIGFYRAGNRRYGAMTMVVLLILAFSVVWSQR
ncbi:MAG: DUF1634 domain-containing protein [Thermomicrobiales bacterium]